MFRSCSLSLRVSGLQNKEQRSGINCNIDGDMVYIYITNFIEGNRKGRIEIFYSFLKKKR